MVDRFEELISVVASDGFAQRIDRHFTTLPSSAACHVTDLVSPRREEVLSKGARVVELLGLVGLMWCCCSY